MRKKRLMWVGIVGLAAVVAVALAGCAGPEGPQGPAGPAGPPGDVTTVPTFVLKFDPDEPGCGGVCHDAPAPWIDPNPEGKYTLAYEANQAYAGHNFDPLGEPKTLGDCLECHAVGTGARAGKGNVSSKSLRDIVHRVHLSSPHFEAAQLPAAELEEEERPGDCFTCHDVSGPSTLGLYD